MPRPPRFEDEDEHEDEDELGCGRQLALAYYFRESSRGAKKFVLLLSEAVLVLVLGSRMPRPPRFEDEHEDEDELGCGRQPAPSLHRSDLECS
jgi:hypothetical protein